MKRPRRDETRPRRRRGLAILALLIVIAAALLIDSNTRIVTTEYEVGAAGLDPALDGFRIVQLSDLHEKTFGNDNDRLVAAVEKARPDLIVITGDLIDDAEYIDYARALSARLVEIAPVYYVSGNHEWATGAMREIFAALKESGVTALRNAHTVIESGGGRFTLAGLEDPNGPYDMRRPEEVMESALSEGLPVVLLAHRNNLAASEYCSLGAELVMSGHAHGGLIRLPFTDGLIDASRELFPKYTSGLYETNGSALLVSRGLGNTRPTFRLFNNPHIPVAVLRAK